MGAKQSTGTPPRMRTYSHAGDGMPMSSNGAAPGGLAVGGAGTSGVSARGRTRSLGSVQQNGSHPGHLNIPSSNGATHGAGASPDSDASTPEEGPLSSLPRGFIQASSLPVQLFPFQGIKCPVCNKFIASDDIECHLVMCLTKPRISYNGHQLCSDYRKMQTVQKCRLNGRAQKCQGHCCFDAEDVLTEDKGECVICLEELEQGDTIARLPCLCIYHKHCIDKWFKVNRSCPEHPAD